MLFHIPGAHVVTLLQHHMPAGVVAVSIPDAGAGAIAIGMREEWIMKIDESDVMRMTDILSEIEASKKPGESMVDAIARHWYGISKDAQ